MRKIAWMLLAAAMTVLVGCGIPAAPQETIPTVETQSPAQSGKIPWQETEVTKKYQNLQLRFWSILEENTADAAVFRQAAAVFEQQTGARVTLTFTAGDEVALKTALAEGQADLIHASDSEFVRENADFLTELTAVMPSGHVMADFVAEEVGKPLCIPQAPAIYGIYYNTTAFESCGIAKVPQNWAEFMQVCKTLKENGWAPLTIDDRDAPVLTEMLLRGRLSQLQLQRLKEQGGWQDSPEAMAVAEEILDFLKAGYLAKGTPGKYPQSSRDLVLSDIAMVFTSNAEVMDGLRYAGTDLDIGVFPCPGGNLAFGGRTLAVAAESSRQEAAMDLILLLTQGEFDQLSADVSGGIPVDVENASLFTGTWEALSDGSLMSPGWWSPEMNEILLAIWQSRYASGEEFAAALEQYSQSVG